MKSLVILPALLVLLCLKSGAGIPFPHMGRVPHRMAMMEHALMFGGPVLDLLQEKALDEPEFRMLKVLCDVYANGDGPMDLNDSGLELGIIQECHNSLQGRPAYRPNLEALQRKATVNPVAARIFNENH
ncbi:uncharacterized protein LOC143297336 [Babylonia areolata]|uniref:uncharacterized protein LOC143297336 n=1 Tax=Babylonia areolata TaxID=304850 RepID=UPI003FD637D3